MTVLIGILGVGNWRGIIYQESSIHVRAYVQFPTAVRSIMSLAPSTSMTPILFARFMLNLRNVDHTSPTSSQDMDPGHLSVPIFATSESRITGNLGEDLQVLDVAEEVDNREDRTGESYDDSMH